MKYVAGVLLILLLAAVAGLFLYRGNAIAAKAELTKAALQHDQDTSTIAALQQKIETEHASAVRLQAVADRFEKEKTDAQDAADRVIAGLRSDNLRLRAEWRGAPVAAGGVPEAATGAGQPDAAAQLREQGAANLVRAAIECDAQVRGLQQIVKDDRALE